MSVRVVVVDDQDLVRGGVVWLLDAAAGVEVVGEAATAASAVDLVERRRPDVVVMDLRLPDRSGAEATADILDRLGGDDAPAVLVLTTFHDDAAVYQALRSGASGFVLKDQAAGHLVEAVETVAAGGSWLDPSVAHQMIDAVRATSYQGRAVCSERVERLTTREQEVLACVALGLSNAEIAEQLVISTATVKTHLSRILLKTASRDRAQAVALAYQSRLVTPP